MKPKELEEREVGLAQVPEDASEVDGEGLGSCQAVGAKASVPESAIWLIP